ncbi:MAG: Ig-like domain-containing protein [Clostridia bacterium]|nr:Ig-like domain-containing protein [Clostridia bacterium]
MSGKIRIGLVTALVCLMTVMPALAAGVFLFTEKSVTLHEGESYQAILKRSGVYDGDGIITYSSSKPGVATVSEDGTITAGSKGDAVIYASLERNGKRVGRAQINVKVVRGVKKVTLSTAGLAIYEPDDPAITPLLEEELEYKVIAVAAGSTVNLSAVCTPMDASNKTVRFTTDDEGVARVMNNKALKAIQRGECDMTMTSADNPEATETFRILVTQPVKSIQIQAENKTVASGSTIRLTGECQPADASIKGIVWASKNPQIASVDSNGNVTGLKRGNAVITATAADGSGAKGNITISVIQPVTGLRISPAEIRVTTGRYTQAKVTVQPADASDKSVTWTSSDERIATVVNGRVTGQKAGTCMVTCASKTNPEITASATVIVSQLVTRIEFTNQKDELSFRTGEKLQLQWEVLPDDATDTAVTFKSAHPKIATVDSNGMLTAISRGTATIYATAQDASKRQAAVRVTVIQPVTGVEMQNPLYYVQLGWSGNVRAIVQPRNANNQRVYWSSEDEDIATIRSNGTSTGHVQGNRRGRTTITACTEDGDFTAQADVRVGNFNEAVMVEGLDVSDNNQIRIVLRNMSDDITLQNIYYTIECFDWSGNPIVCNTDEESTFFTGYYPFEVLPRERTVHGCFRFQNYMIDEPLGMVILTVTGWRDIDGVTWTIPESERVPRQWVSMD